MKHENMDVKKGATTGKNTSFVHRIVKRKRPKIIMLVFILVQISFYI